MEADNIQKFKEMCEVNPELCEEMAKDGDILEKSCIKTCQNLGIKIDKEIISMVEKITSSSG